MFRLNVGISRFTMKYKRNFEVKKKNEEADLPINENEIVNQYGPACRFSGPEDKRGSAYKEDANVITAKHVSSHFIRLLPLSYAPLTLLPFHNEDDEESNGASSSLLFTFGRGMSSLFSQASATSRMYCHRK